MFESLHIRQNYDVEFSKIRFVSFYAIIFYQFRQFFSSEIVRALPRYIFHLLFSVTTFKRPTEATHSFPPIFSMIIIVGMVQLRHRFSPHTNFDFFFFFFNVLMCIWKWTNFVATLYYQSQCDIRCFHSYSCALSFFFPSTKVCETEHFCFFLTSISYMQSQTLGIRYNIVSSVAAMAAAATV